jgi:hypothetical protein
VDFSEVAKPLVDWYTGEYYDRLEYAHQRIIDGFVAMDYLTVDRDQQIWPVRVG